VRLAHVADRLDHTYSGGVQPLISELFAQLQAARGARYEEGRSSGYTSRALAGRFANKRCFGVFSLGGFDPARKPFLRIGISCNVAMSLCTGRPLHRAKPPIHYLPPLYIDQKHCTTVRESVVDRAMHRLKCKFSRLSDKFNCRLDSADFWYWARLFLLLSALGQAPLLYSIRFPGRAKSRQRDF